VGERSPSRGVAIEARRAALGLGVALAAGALLPLSRAPLLDGLSALLVLGFRDVAWIGPEAVARSQAAEHKSVLLDARSEAEFAVSRLPGARRVDPDGPDAAWLAPLSKDTPLVVYCAVGYRSGNVARRLKQAGFGRVSNLQGGVFRWAREGRPLVDDSGSTQRIHPYGAVWGWLLVEPRHRAVAPRAVGN
jgi:rhodanese-related sulfurtransferase